LFTCAVLGANAIANDPKQLSNLEVTATSVVFLSVPDGAAPPASIEAGADQVQTESRATRGRRLRAPTAIRPGVVPGPK
jgi:hypothetical protein